ncbi:hypothetical protein ACFVWT_04125 [Arthrobacter sp. NPDC058288]|uniref:hypothetical protein n=1 Tax=Arthrobacter sp. NPDC058288 TaxID=3346424 RepID=UPI0036E26E96
MLAITSLTERFTAMVHQNECFYHDGRHTVDEPLVYYDARRPESTMIPGDLENELYDANDAVELGNLIATAGRKCLEITQASTRQREQLEAMS